MAILGGAAFWAATPDEAERGFAMALDRGVNHLDIAPQYGAAEERIGPLVPAVRDRMFLACKTLRSNPDGVRAQLEHSLELFGTDHFDLYQLHGVTDLDVLDERVDAAEAILGRPRRGPGSSRRHHRARPGGTGGAPRGAAPLGPRHA